MIGVFRIYLGQAWVTSGRAAALQGLFDSLPEFLCRTSFVTAEEAAAATTPEARRAAARIAMTQAHVLVLPAGEPAPDDVWTEHEVAVARAMVRQRLPVVAVLPPGVPWPGPRTGPASDATARWSAEDVACAIQGAVEAAAVEHRARQRSLEKAGSNPGRWDADISAEARALPMSAIVSAFTAYRNGRQPASTDGSSV